MTGVQAYYEKPLTPWLRIDTSVIDVAQAVTQLLACRNTHPHPLHE